jgi:hypothetical protein
MARVSPPSSDAIVDVPDELVEHYKQQGWAVDGGEPVKPFSQLNKAELEQVASDEGVDLAGLSTNKEYRDAIEAARKK